MSKIQIWHNPRCSKSREALKLLEEAGVEPEVVKYLDVPHTKEEIKNLIKMLGAQIGKRADAHQRGDLQGTRPQKCR